MSTATLHIKKKKALVPKLRFQEFDGEWEKNILKEICTFFSGGTPTSTDKKLYNGNIPFIGSGNIYDSEVKNYITEEALNGSSAKLVKIGDILYALYGANSGEVAISKMQGAINQAILCIRTKSDFNEFVYYLLLLNKDKIVSKYLQGGQGNLSADIIKKLKYSFPSLPEQQKIASFLSAVDEKIQQLSRKKELLEQYKKGVMQQLFSGKLRFKPARPAGGDENGKDYPEWEEKKLGEIGKFYAGGDLDKLNYSKIKSKEFIYPIYANGSGEGIYGYATTFQYKKNSVTVSGRGNLGYANVRTQNFNAIVRLIVIEPKIFINPKYLEEIINQTKFAIESTGVPQLTVPQIKSYKIIIPSYQEQQKIANFLSSIDGKIESTSKQINQTQGFKKGLLQQLFV
jgi:type I restriction enzyme S subunit